MRIHIKEITNISKVFFDIFQQLKNTVSSHIQEKAHLSSQMTELTLLFKNTEEKAKM